MAAITWDGTGERFYESGVSKGVLYVQNTDGTYQSGVAWNGLTAVNESPEGAEPTDLWADNIKYATLISAETFNATIEAYTYPNEFMQCDGSYVPADGVYVGQQERKNFGFCYRTEVGNDVSTSAGYKIHVIYGCTAAPSARDYATINDSPDAITLSWEVRTTPVNVTGKKPTSSITIDTTKLSETARTTYLPVLETKLYGGTNSSATLPTPDTIISIITTGQE